MPFIDTAVNVCLEIEMDFIVRTYDENDLGAVLSAWENASRLAHPFLSDAFLSYERDQIVSVHLPVAETWGVEKEGKVVGFIALIGSEVGAIFVQPEFHGKGAGRLLMDKAKQLCGALEVEVFEANEIGRAFYAKSGFQPLSESIHEQTGNRMLRLRFDPSN